VNSTLTGPVATYLAQVRAELSDLPPGELEDVLEDVSGHLTEVAAEFEQEPTAAALDERLGNPRQYADELRTAAGYPPRTQTAEDRGAGRKALRWGIIACVAGPFFLVMGVFGWSLGFGAFFAVLGLATLFGAAYLGVRALHGQDPRIVLDNPRGAQLAESIRGLVDQIPPNARRELVTIGQPVWWVARGMVGGGGFFAVFGAGAVTVVGALAGAAVSIWIGRRTQQDRRWLWYVVPLNLIAMIAVPVWLAASFVGGSYGLISFSNNSGNNDYRGTNYVPSGLALDGQAVTNIYPFDAQGRQVSVRLYDQNGQPLSVRVEDCASIYGPNTNSTDPLSNLFPQPVLMQGSDAAGDAASCKDTTAAPFVPPPFPASTTPKPGTTPSAGTTPTPTATTPRPGPTLTISPTR
jgi:hypothetical protein